MNLNASSDARSLGLKLILVGALAFVLWIPAMLVYALVWDRSTRADTVINEIVERAGGRQAISGPIILVPATIDTGRTDKDGDPILRSATAAFTPKKLNINARAETSQRRRSIYKASVYDANIVMTGRFEEMRAPSAEGPVTLDWDKAQIAVKFASPAHLKGVRDTISLKLNAGATRTDFEPGIEAGNRGGERQQSAPGVSTPLNLANAQAGFAFELSLPLAGGGAIYFAPVGEDTVVQMSSDWPDPGFQGAYLPDEHDISAAGFTASWRVPYLARAIPRSFFANPQLNQLDGGFYDHTSPHQAGGKTFGVEFVAATSPYKSVNRALKYALMFLGIVFLTFFLFEATMGGRAHPAQYILLGATQVIFYLLVLAFAEHIGFGLAFFLTAGATVALSGYYAATVFHSKIRGIIAFAAFSASYGLIYLLMKSEDYALLIGSVTAFGALALTIVVTRNLDWYGVRKQINGSDTSEPAQ